MAKKISIKQYNRALKIIESYQQQKQKYISGGTYGFLYWLDNRDGCRGRWIKAKNIDSACRTFLRSKPESLYSVDYEVSYVNKKHLCYIDIGDRPEFQEWIK